MEIYAKSMGNLMNFHRNYADTTDTIWSLTFLTSENLDDVQLWRVKHQGMLATQARCRAMQPCTQTKTVKNGGLGTCGLS